MDNLTSLDIYALLEEIRPRLIDAKVEAIQHIDNEIVLRLFKGCKFDLLISSGIGLWISDYKREAPKTPDNFCMLLRKDLKGERLTSVTQHMFDRVVEFGFSNGMKLIAEFFAKGNIILCDADYTIIHALMFKEFGSRCIKPKPTYLFPRAGKDPVAMTQAEFSAHLKAGEKDIVRTLVMDFNIAGHYAEFAIGLAGIDKGSLCKDLSPKGTALLFDGIKAVLSDAAKRPAPNISADGLVLPLLLPAHASSQTFDSFNSAIDSFFANKPPKEERSKRSEKVLRTIEKQESLILELEQEALREKEVGDLISANAGEIDDIIRTIRSAKKKHSIDEIREIISKSPYSKKIVEISHDKLVLEL